MFGFLTTALSPLFTNSGDGNPLSSSRISTVTKASDDCDFVLKNKSIEVKYMPFSNVFGSTKKLCDNGSQFCGGGGGGIVTLPVSTRSDETVLLPNDRCVLNDTLLKGLVLIVNDAVFVETPCEVMMFLALVNVVPSEFVGLSVILNSR